MYMIEENNSVHSVYQQVMSSPPVQSGSQHCELGKVDCCQVITVLQQIRPCIKRQGQLMRLPSSLG